MLKSYRALLALIAVKFQIIALGLFYVLSIEKEQILQFFLFPTTTGL